MKMIEKFMEKWKKNPILFETKNTIGLKLYRIMKDQEDIDIEGNRFRTDHIIQVDYNPRNIILPKEDKELILNCVQINNMRITRSLSAFLKLKNIDSKCIAFTNVYDESKYKAVIIDVDEYKNYLNHVKKILLVKSKMNKIIKDRFSVNRSTSSPNTSAILSNIGYLIKNKEGEYLSLSKGDRTFIQNFIFNQIANGTYTLKVTESLPMFKEDIKNIIEIGSKILKLNNNKKQIKSFSRKYLNKERGTLESVWQLYFEKYLRMFFMGYKSFYPQTTFASMEGYEKESRPDFLAVDLYNNIDIIEIKHHRTKLFRKENNRDSYYPSHDLNKSVFQLNKYLDLTSNLINTNQIQDKYIRNLIENNKIYRPRGILIISSKDFITSSNTSDSITARLEKEIKKLKTTYKNIEIILFDELIDSLSKYLEDIEVTIDSGN